MRSNAIALTAACVLWCTSWCPSCAEEEPRFGPPGAIAKQVFPGEQPAPGDGGGAAATTAPFPEPYDEQSPPKEARSGADIHAGKAVIEPATDCSTCHGATPVAGAPSYAFAGLAFDGPGDAVPLSFGEVIVYAGTDVFAIVKTTSDGYFSFPADAGPVPQAARTAIRDKNGRIAKMTAPLSGNGACNATGCHGGTAGRVDFKP